MLRVIFLKNHNFVLVRLVYNLIIFVLGNMSPIPGSDNSKEDEAVVPFPFSNFDAPHEHPVNIIHSGEDQMSHSGHLNRAYVNTENLNGACCSIPHIDLT